MRKPLSYFEYFKGNKKKIFSFIISISLSVFLIGSIEMLLNNVMKTAMKPLGQYEYFTKIESKDKPFEEEFVKKLKENHDIERIIPIQMGYVDYYGIAIGRMCHCYFMEKEDISYLIDKLKINFDKSSIPKNDENKLLLNEDIKKNNRFVEGNKIKEEDKVKLYKSFKSDLLIGFVSKTMNKNNHSYIIVPKENKLKDVNEFIKEEKTDDVELTRPVSWENAVDSLISDVKQLFNIVTIMLLFSIGIGLGISSYVHYYQRRKEFGIMSSMGYAHKDILMKINKEVLITTFGAFVVGFLLLNAEKLAINKLVLEKIGVPLFKLEVEIISRVIIIPLFASVFSLIPTWVLLKKVDSISIIEGAAQ